MSLINDALKKAQQLQTQGQPTPNPGVTPNAPVVTESPQASSGQAGSPRASSASDRSMPGQFFMLLAFGAGALIAVSVLATVYLLRRPATPVVVQTPAVLSQTVAAAPVVAQTPATSSAPVPVVKAPALALPLSIPPVTPAEVFAPAPAPVVTKLPAPPPTAVTAPVTAPAVAAVPSPAPTLSVTPAASLFSPPPAAPATIDPSKPDPKILAYLDALQIAGIRVSDTGSKVLMNDRVFRENEIVDHLLGLRLKKVESDNLTFVDERGVIYTKNL
jgi:hypothetical protein